MLQERSNNTVSFVEHLKFQEKLAFADSLCINCSQFKKKKKTELRTLYILKLLHTGCSTKEAISLLLSWSTYHFENKSLWHIICYPYLLLDFFLDFSRGLNSTDNNLRDVSQVLNFTSGTFLWYFMQITFCGNIQNLRNLQSRIHAKINQLKLY